MSLEPSQSILQQNPRVTSTYPHNLTQHFIVCLKLYRLKRKCSYFRLNWCKIHPPAQIKYIYLTAGTVFLVIQCFVYVNIYFSANVTAPFGYCTYTCITIFFFSSKLNIFKVLMLFSFILYHKG